MAFITPISRNETNAQSISSESDRAQVVKNNPVTSVTPTAAVTSGNVTAVPTSSNAGGSFNAIESSLQTLLAETNLKSIKLMLPLIKEATFIFKEITQFDTKLPAALESKELLGIDREIKNLITALTKDGVMLSEESLKDPKELVKILLNFADPKTKVAIDEAKKVLTEVTANLPPREDFAILKVAHDNLAEILSRVGNVPLSQIREDLTAFFKSLKTLFSENSPIIKDETAAIIKTILADIENVLGKDQKEAGPAELKKILGQAISQIKDLFSGKDPKEVAKIFESARLVDQLETLTQAQTNLSQINTVMNTLGEPSLFVFAILIGGFLSRIKLTHDPVDEETRKKGGKGGFAQVNMKVDLPGLGQVAVYLAHRSTELLLRVTLENEELAQFLESRAPKLRKALNRMGYELKGFDISSGDLKKIDPTWTKSVLDPNEVIA